MIITAEEGAPQSEPDIVRAVAVDHTRISISWEPGLLKNGPILFYVLQVKESNDDEYQYKVQILVNFLLHQHKLFLCTFFRFRFVFQLNRNYISLHQFAIFQCSISLFSFSLYTYQVIDRCFRVPFRQSH